jgi:predicted small secreted protein
MKHIVTGLIALLAVGLLSACNTVAGMGKDIEKGGEAIQRATGK